MSNLIYAEESYIIRGVAFDVYKKFRNNHKEKIYRDSFYFGLKQKNLKVEREKRIDIYYADKKVGAYVPDLVINDSIFIELKAKPVLYKEDLGQFWHYLKNSGYKLGFLINFGAPRGVQIVRRVYTPVKSSVSIPCSGSAYVPRPVPRSSAEDGFTLIELLIYVAIFIIIVPLSMSMLVTITGGRDTSNARYEVVQNLRFASEKIRQFVFDASSFTVSGTCPLNTLEVTISGATTTVSIVSGVLQTTSTSTTNQVTSNLVTATTDASCLFTSISNPAPAKPTLQFQLKISYNDGGNPKLIFSDTIKSTISRRQ